MLRLKRKFSHGAAWIGLFFTLLALGKVDCAAAPVAMPAIVLSWNASTDPNVAGYSVYYGTNSGNYSTRIDVGTNTSDSFTNLTPGTEYYFSVTAYNAAGIESPPSDQIAVTMPNLLQLNMAGPATGVTLGFTAVAGHWYQLQAASDLQNWTTIWQSPVASQNAWTTFQDNTQGAANQRFYRLVVH